MWYIKYEENVWNINALRNGVELPFLLLLNIMVYVTGISVASYYRWQCLAVHIRLSVREAFLHTRIL
jgi:hypothetical protein